MRLGLSVYGTVFDMGISPESGRPPITPIQLMERALAAGLTGIELPDVLLQGQDIAEVARYAREHELFISLAASGYHPTRLAEVIERGAQLGVSVVRTIVGGAKIGGDRRPLADRWQAFLQDVLAGLKAAVQVAERVDVPLAVENHQDLASEELLWLCESIASPCFGITLDTGNPLATAEVPLDFARRVAPYVKNVHLKDYWIYLSEEGYRLVRAPLGQGVIDFPALLEVLAQHCPTVPLSIELGALEARHIRVLADDYWPDYPPRSAAQLVKVLRLVMAQAKPAGDWRTPYEQKEPVEVIVAYERRQLASSLAYIVPLFAAADHR